MYGIVFVLVLEILKKNKIKVKTNHQSLTNQYLHIYKKVNYFYSNLFESCFWI